jgi:hypothetical protein
VALILLRHQPNVEVLEYRLVEEGGWTDDLEAWAHYIAEELFGISEYDIDDDLEPHFEAVFRMMRDESDAYWAKHGWDVTDGEGKELKVMDYLTRPMVCLVEQLHPDARFKMSTDSWAAQLEADAKRFRPTR